MTPQKATKGRDPENREPGMSPEGVSQEDAYLDYVWRRMRCALP